MRKLSVLVLLFVLGSCIMVGERKETLEGELGGHPVSAPVEIVYDQNGVPHIMAETDRDLFYGLGYAMAQDRFFFMDLLRKVGRGELGRLFGKLPHYGSYNLANGDRLMRSFDFASRAEEGVTELDPESRSLLGAFTLGVNRYLADAQGKLPEYRALGISPDPWSESDSLVCMEVFGLSMTLYSFFYEYYAGRLMREFGPEAAELFIPEYPADAPYINQDALPTAADDRAVEQMFSAMMPALPALSAIGSNNWVVDGTMSASGFPILANDPHVPYPTSPTFWYAAHLKGDSFDAAGLIFPGIPLMGAGANGSLAWGITNARCDYIDIFVEKLNPENPGQYLHQGEWREFETINETVAFRNWPSLSYTWRRSVHGAVIEPAMTGYPLPESPGRVLTLKLIEVEFGRFFAGYLNIPRSRDAASFRRAIEDMAMGPVAWNTVYATVDGDIGYLYSGHAPIRPDNQGVLPRPGAGEAEWGGWIPFDELPHIDNPQKHFIVTANNKVEPPGYPYYLSSGYNIPSRAARITELLAGRTGLTVDDMLEIQMDVKVKSAEEFAPIFLSDLAGSGEPELEKIKAALEHWRDNDYRAGIDSIGTAPYKLMMSELGRLTFEDELGKKLTANMGMADMVIPALWKILPDKNNPWFNDQRTPQRETRKDMVRAAAREVYGKLKKNLGPDPEDWQWGGMHKLAIRHPLGFLPWNRKARVGTYPREGTEECVNNASGLLLMGEYLGLAGPSSRISVDLAKPDLIYFNSTTGNSENPRSPLFKNTTDDWLAGRYQELSLNPAEFRKGAIGELRLSP